MYVNRTELNSFTLLYTNNDDDDHNNDLAVHLRVFFSFNVCVVHVPFFVLLNLLYEMNPFLKECCSIKDLFMWGWDWDWDLSYKFICCCAYALHCCYYCYFDVWKMILVKANFTIKYFILHFISTSALAIEYQKLKLLSWKPREYFLISSSSSSWTSNIERKVTCNNNNIWIYGCLKLFFIYTS